MPDNDDAVTQAALAVAELALAHRDELEKYREHLERHYYRSAAHDMRQFLDAITTYERRKHLA